MMTVSESGVGLTPGLHGRARRVARRALGGGLRLVRLCLGFVGLCDEVLDSLCDPVVD